MVKRIVLMCQITSLLGIWCFSLGISVWIIHLIRTANRLQDATTGSLAISLIAIPVFLTVACVLTYVFVGLQLGKEER